PRDNSVRVTMDRQVRCVPELAARLNTRMDNPVIVFGREVVLELKFTDHFPDWFKELVRVFGLMQCGAAKYVDGVTIMGVEKFSRCAFTRERARDREARLHDPPASAFVTSSRFPGSVIGKKP